MQGWPFPAHWSQFLSTEQPYGASTHESHNSGQTLLAELDETAFEQNISGALRSKHSIGSGFPLHEGVDVVVVAVLVVDVLVVDVIDMVEETDVVVTVRVVKVMLVVLVAVIVDGVVTHEWQRAGQFKLTSTPIIGLVQSL